MLLGVALCLAGCGRDSGDGARNATSVGVVTVSPTLNEPTTLDVRIQQDVRVPNLSRVATVPYENAVVIEAARGGLMSQCMAALGHDYVAPVVPKPSTSEPDDLYPSDEILAQYGYTWTLHSQGSAEPTSVGSDQDPDFSEALDGCGATALARLDFSRFVAAQSVLANAETQEIDPSVDVDAQVLSALAAWRGCMIGSGYSFEDPIEAQRSTSADPLGRNSIALAIHDYTCRRATGMEETRRAASTRLTAAWIERHPEAIAELNLALDELTARAADVVAELDS